MRLDVFILALARLRVVIARLTVLRQTLDVLADDGVVVAADVAASAAAAGGVLAVPRRLLTFRREIDGGKSVSVFLPRRKNPFES